MGSTAMSGWQPSPNHTDHIAEYPGSQLATAALSRTRGVFFAVLVNAEQ